MLGFLPDNCQNQAQINTVVPSQKEMDRVGAEPTTSAYASILVQSFVNGKKHIQISPSPYLTILNHSQFSDVEALH
jgi:hypothetical protein